MITIKTDMEILINDSYKVLALICANQIMIRGESYCPLSQQELAELSEITRSKLNTIIKKLKDNGFIKTKTRHYYPTERAMDIVGMIDSI